MAKMALHNINKIYPNGFQAVYDFNIDIEDGEFIVLVGPSGCGKSTTLRMIAGLEDITNGDFTIGDVRMNDVHAKNRGTAMVFQSYALYPQMNVYENIAFGLKLRKVPDDEIDERVEKVAKKLGLEDYLERKPRELSGGQRQRVALGRVIVRNADVFLMDEPLSNLDAKLRVQMRAELIKLHQDLGTTTIYVTHDQIEAMTMGTRIVVMSHGYIQQIGAPKEVYEDPNNVFVAGFIGSPPMNFIEGVVTSNGKCKFDNLEFDLPKDKVDIIGSNGMLDKEIIIGIRPEDLYDEKTPNEFNNSKFPKVTLEVEVFEMLGAETIVICKYKDDKQFILKVEPRLDLKIGQQYTFSVDVDKLYFFTKGENNEPTTQKRIK